MIIVCEKEKCIGCGSCVAVAPEIFCLDSKEKVCLLKNKYSKEVEQAIQICPVQCIKIDKNDRIKSKGKKSRREE